MRSIDGRVAKLEAASSAKTQVFVLKIGDQTLESAIESWMAANPGKRDPRHGAEMTILQVNLVGGP
jgi:hypothetical protein